MVEVGSPLRRCVASLLADLDFHFFSFLFLFFLVILLLFLIISIKAFLSGKKCFYLVFLREISSILFATSHVCP